MVVHSRWIRCSIAAVSLLSAGACTGLTSNRAAPTPRVSLLTVENRGWEDVTLFVVRGGVPIRIGTVRGLSSELIAVSVGVTGIGQPFQLRGRRRLTGEQFDTQLFTLDPGAAMRLIVEQVPGFSSLSIR